MITPANLAEAYGRNVEIIKLQTEGLSQADSLVQLPFRANCMNWIVGHIVTNRHSVLKLLSRGISARSRARQALRTRVTAGEMRGGGRAAPDRADRAAGFGPSADSCPPGGDDTCRARAVRGHVWEQAYERG